VKILLFGGSFDPPHRGHERLLRAALNRLRPDRAYIVPAYRSPFKSGHQASPVHRLGLAEVLRNRLPAAWRKRVEISSYELRHKRPSYTFQTLRYFRTKHPSAQIWFLTGSDSLASFSRWARHRELQKACHWIVGRRAEARTPRNKLPPHEILPGRFPPISSTDVRCKLIAGLETRDILSTPVLAYIRRHELYGVKIHKELKHTLSPERFRHTLEVARLALKLAYCHGFDPEKTATAALLHDAGRRFRPEQMARYAGRRHLRVPALKEIIQNAPLLLHAYISEDLAQRRFKIRDQAILSAIRNHTLGAVGMAGLDRLLYVADVASEDRGFPEAFRIRKLALRNLRAAFVSAADTKLRYVRKNDLWLHPGSQRFETWCHNRA